MNTWAKGSKAEKLYEEILQKDGWLTRRWPKSKFNKQDLWGCDILAKKGGKTLFVQVKSRKERVPPLEKATLKALKELWKHLNHKNEQIHWVGYNCTTKKWRVVHLNDNLLHR